MVHDDCTKCGLHKHATNVGMDGNGASGPDILIVVDAASRWDDKNGEVCHASNPAMSMLRALTDVVTKQTGLKFRFTSAVRCPPIDTKDGRTFWRTPAPKELTACLPYLKEEVDATQPKVVILAGGTALKAVLGRDCRIGDMRGNPVWRDRVYVPTYHPVNIIPRRGKDGKIVSSLTSPEQYQEMLMQDLGTAANIALGTMTKPAEIVWDIVTTRAGVLETLIALQEAQHAIPMLGMDIETNTYSKTEVDNIFKPGLKILCIGLSWEVGKTKVIPLDQEACEWKDDHEFQRGFIHALWALSCKFVLQNGMYDFVALHLKYGVSPWHAYHDTLLMHHLLYSHRRHALRELAKIHTPFGGYDDEVKTLVGALPVKERGYHKIPFKAVARKNAYDAAITLELGMKFLAQVEADEQLRWVYDEVTIPVGEPLMEMSLWGVGMSVEDARNAQVDNAIIHNKIRTILAEAPEWKKAEELLGCPLEVSKTMHRQVLLFTKECCGLTAIKLSKKTGMPSSDKIVLEELSNQSPIAYGVRKLRALETFNEKTLKPLPGWIGWDGRVHPQFKIFGTRTGRLSSAEPNCQNFSRSALGMIKASPGRVLIVCDISQAEVRMNGVVCNEPVLLNAFSAGVGPDGKPIDIHATVAQDMFGIDYVTAKIDEEVRRIVKGLNFGMSYGMTAHGLSVRIHKSIPESQEIVDLYFKKLPRIKLVLFEETKELLLKHGYVRSLFGRYWHLNEQQKAMFHDLKGSPYFWDKPGPSRALRQCGNFRIQSPTSDMVLRGLLRFNELKKQLVVIGHWKVDDVPFANEIHDSVILEAREEVALEAAGLLKYCMEHPDVPIEIPIPWVADLKWGRDMGHLEKLELEAA